MITKLCPDAFFGVTSFLCPGARKNLCSISSQVRSLALDSGGWIKKTTWGKENGPTFKIFLRHCEHRSLSHVNFYGLENPLLWLPRKVKYLELKHCTQEGKQIEDGIYTLSSSSFQNGPWNLCQMV